MNRVNKHHSFIWKNRVVGRDHFYGGMLKRDAIPLFKMKLILSPRKQWGFLSFCKTVDNILYMGSLPYILSVLLVGSILKYVRFNEVQAV